MFFNIPKHIPMPRSVCIFFIKPKSMLDQFRFPSTLMWREKYMFILTLSFDSHPFFAPFFLQGDEEVSNTEKDVNSTEEVGRRGGNEL